MPKSRIDIQESLQELETLEEQHRDTSLEGRVTMLKMLKNDPSIPFQEISRAIGSSERSLQRWWGTYQREGLEALLQMGQRGGKRPRRIDDEALQALREKIAREGFSELKEAQQWLQEEFGVTYSRSGAWHLMRSAVGAVPRGWMLIDGREESKQGIRQEIPQSSTGISADVIKFLNSLPTSSSVLEWGSLFREALQELLRDVDRISVNVNADCSLSNPEEYSPALTITQVQEESAPSVSAAQGHKAPFERLLDTIRKQGYPMEKYHPPECYDYYYEGTAYLGTIFLWREIAHPPISERTLEIIRLLEPFLIFALSDLVARHQAEKPIDRVFHAALGTLVVEAGLTPQEQRIVVLQLMGHAYKDMADILNVSIDTVKKHFKQIHRKTGTRGQAELFAKYFTSRLIPEELRESAR